MKKLLLLVALLSMLSVAGAPTENAGDWLTVNGASMRLVQGTIPEQMGQAAVQYNDGGTIIYAHSFLSGELFYDLSVGDVVMLQRGSAHQDYRVTKIGTFQAVEPYKADSPLYLPDYVHTISFSDAIHSFMAPKDLTLYTCWALEHGHGITRGRLFLELTPTQ